MSKLPRWAARTMLFVLLPVLLMIFLSTAAAQPDNRVVIDGNELIPADEIPPLMEQRGVVRLATLKVPQDFFVVPPDPGFAEPVTIPIDNVRSVGLLENTRRESGNRVYVTGEVIDKPFSSFSMVVEDGLVQRGRIRLHNEVIFLSTIESAPDHIKMQMTTVEPTALPEAREPVLRKLPNTGQGDPPPPDPGETDTVVKIMVVYSEAARHAVDVFFNQSMTIEELIDDTVFLSNFAFELHGNFVLELVHMEKVNYAETGDIEKDLDRLACPCDHMMKGIGDNHLNEVFEPWKTHEADIVSLWLNYIGDSGIANIMSEVTTDFAPFGVSVVDWGAAIFNYSFEHEIGHNFGARHHRTDDPTSGQPYKFNHGWMNLPQEKVTIMSYRSVCPLGVECDRVAVWSNPEYSPAGTWGVATGVDAADNARTLRDSKGTISQLFEQGQDWIGCCTRSGGLFSSNYQPGKCP